MKTDYLYQRGALAVLLAPVALLFCFVVTLRRQLYRLGVLRSRRLPVPVVVIGNITVGGTGKTPLVAAVARHLAEAGWKPGIVSRGYGGKAPTYPFVVDTGTDPAVSGDEALLLAMKTGLPVAVDPRRPRGAARLVREGCDVIISDDGLQHYALQRNVEVAVVDGRRRLGNGWCLPAGPLREPRSRLRYTNMVVCNGGAPMPGEEKMSLRPTRFVNVFDPALRQGTDAFQGKAAHAVAGIGNPERFFVTLDQLGARVRRHPKADHHIFSSADLLFSDSLPVLMTEKDAVKCRRLTNVPPEVQQRCWALAVEAVLSEGVADHLALLIKENTT